MSGTKPPPDMFAIGSPQWPGLSKLAEESGEVVQVIGKLMGNGGERDHWDGTNLRARLFDEVADLLAACDFVVEMNGFNLEQRRQAKLELFRKWHRDGLAARKGSK